MSNEYWYEVAFGNEFSTFSPVVYALDDAIDFFNELNIKYPRLRGGAATRDGGILWFHCNKTKMRRATRALTHELKSPVKVRMLEILDD